MTIKNVPGLVDRITSEIRAFTDVAVVGLSGGIDSTLVATLCTLALGPNNVFGIHMPYSQKDSATFNSRSKKLAVKLGIRSTEIGIRFIADDIGEAIRDFAEFTGTGSSEPSQLNLGNARSRARMTALYGIASHLNESLGGKRARVMGTGNMSEDYIGYDTKGGDALADIFPIGELFKSEVYQLADHFRDIGVLTDDLIDRVPSAGLWDGQTDESELGHSYNSMEPVIKDILAGKPADLLNPLTKFVVDRHNANKHKHLAPPVVSIRSQFCD